MKQTENDQNYKKESTPVVDINPYGKSQVIIPVTISGLPVTSIESIAFGGLTSLTNVIIPDSVTNIGVQVFYNTRLASVKIPNKVTSIGLKAFSLSSLTSVTIGSSVTGIASQAFAYCTNLTTVYFRGNIPNPTNDTSVFLNDSNATAYYLPQTIEWGAAFDGLPTVLWNPQVKNDASFGVQNNQFGFNITGSSNLVIVVEACTNLANPVWSPVSTNTLNSFIGTNGMSYFSDSQWTNYP
jgi:hypothetical protein